MGDWNGLLEKVVTTTRHRCTSDGGPDLNDLLPDDAVISLDCGANTHFAARCLQLKAGQRLTGTGMLATMAPGLPYAIAAKLAYPDRPSVAVVGDGGFAMLMAELTTAVANKLSVKIVILKNNSLAEVKFEQREIGNPEFGCIAGAVVYFLVGRNSHTAQADSGVTTESTAAAVGARVLPTDPPLKAEPK